MSVNIIGVERFSPAAKAGVLPGDVLVSINAHPIQDVLDYRFYIMEKKLKIVVERDGGELCFTVKKGEYDETGMEFETYLMDKQRSCKNGCIFCFIDQLPKGMRESLYFKDDDSRLSFLFGNYITLTNLSEREVDRIIEMHISPVNVSVHTTDPELRCKMMRNRFAGDTLKYLKRFADAGIKMNCQLVLCKGINDGKKLQESLEYLGSLYPAVSSVAAVPVGITDYREGLFELEPYDKESARSVVDIMVKFGDEFKAKKGTRLCYPSDEFFLKSEYEMPSVEFYEELAQLENGVGMWALFLDEFCFALEDAQDKRVNKKMSIATGKAAYPLLCKVVNIAQQKFPDLDVTVYEITNNFFGKNITVSGLITGQDLVDQLKYKDLGEQLLLSDNMLRREGDMLLDNMTPDQLSDKLGVEVRFVKNDGAELLQALLGE